MEKIFLHCEDAEKRRKIDILARGLKIRTKYVFAKDLKRTVGAVTGFTKDARTNVVIPADYQMPEIMVFSGLSPGKLDLFLKACRQAEIESIPLKAMVTKMNVNWSFYHLIEELKKEHERMMEMEKRN